MKFLSYIVLTGFITSSQFTCQVMHRVLHSVISEQWFNPLVQEEERKNENSKQKKREMKRKQKKKKKTNKREKKRDEIAGLGWTLNW